MHILLYQQHLYLLVMHALICEQSLFNKAQPHISHPNLPQKIHPSTPTQTHTIVIRAQNDIFKPNIFFIFTLPSANSLLEHTHVSQALNILEQRWQCLRGSILLSRVELGKLLFPIHNRISFVARGSFMSRKILMAQFLNIRPILQPKAFTKDQAFTKWRLSIQLLSLLLFILSFVLPSNRICQSTNLV